MIILDKDRSFWKFEKTEMLLAAIALILWSTVILQVLEVM